MDEYRENRLQRDSLDILRKEGKFFEFVLVAWGIIEFNLDNVILREYSLSSQSPKSDILLGINFDRKLGLQKKLSFLTTQDYTKVKEFQEWRNKFFHKNGIFVSNLSQSEKNSVMNIATRAVDVTHNLREQVFSLI
jgi:hypothetical protein